MSLSVTLAKPWFGPGGTRYRAGRHDGLPDDFRSQLPSSATVHEVEDEPVAVPAKVTPDKAK